MNAYGLPQETWVRYLSRLTYHDIDEDMVRKVASMEDYFDMLVFFLRMAHTPPERLFPIKNRGDYTKATRISVAWSAMVMVQGSLYEAIPSNLAGKIAGWEEVREAPTNDATINEGAPGLLPHKTNPFWIPQDDPPPLRPHQGPSFPRT
jgi:hypothetical protein